MISRTIFFSGKAASSTRLQLMIAVGFFLCFVPFAKGQVQKGSETAQTVVGEQKQKLNLEEIQQHIHSSFHLKQVTSPKISVSSAATSNSAIIGVLQKQKEIAKAEHTEMLQRRGAAGAGNAVHPETAGPVAVGAVLTKPTQASDANPGKPSQTAVGAISSVATAAPTQPVPVAPTSQAQVVAIAKAPSNPPFNGAGVKMAVCALRPPSIESVSGQAKGAVFTPDPDYNEYTIRGCHFGDTQGTLHIYGSFKSHIITMTVELWTDEYIHAFLDPNVVGELDQDNVNLVVAPVGAAEILGQGFKFHAVRETQELSRIPGQAATFAGIAAGLRPGGYASPDPYHHATAGMFRGDEVIYKGWASHPDLPEGQDYYDFSQMKPGFALQSYQLIHLDMFEQDCTDFAKNKGGDAILYVHGHTNSTSDATSITVNFGTQSCHPKDFGQESVSEYALSVWVFGPKGVDPWPSSIN